MCFSSLIPKIISQLMALCKDLMMHAFTFITFSKFIPIFANCATSFYEDTTFLQQPPYNMICFSCNKFLNSYNPLATTF